MSRRKPSRGKGKEAESDVPTAPTRELPAWLPLGVVLLVSSVVVGAAFLPAPHDGGDNAAYVTLAYSLVAHGSYTDLYDPAQLPHTKYPPVFPGILALLVLLGARTWASLKIVSAVSTVAAVGFTYAWARGRLGTWGAAGVALALSLSTAVVYYSHWILSDMLFVAFTAASLWALERADREAEASPVWMASGVVAAGLAYFTRSAGLPLVAALLLWLVLRKKWKSLGATVVGLGLPALLWWWRGRGEGVAEYGAEFWMIDPYQPELGTVGVVGLIGRTVVNARLYLTQHLAGGVVGGSGALVLFVGVALTALAAYGWFRSARERIGPAELFLPAYAGLILLWPEVWSGDRFALPLYPLMFCFAGVAIVQVGQRWGVRGVRGLALAALLAVVLPAGSSWLRSVRSATACASVVRAAGPWSCYREGIRDYVGAATWIGEALPDGSAVMTRKPRLFYVLSGVPSRTFPFLPDVGEQLRVADEVGARYVLMDQWDGLSTRYVGSALQQNSGAFCSLRGFGQGQGIGTHLLGIRAAGERIAPPEGAPGEIRIGACPPSFLESAPADYSPSSSGRIPLLDGLVP